MKFKREEMFLPKMTKNFISEALIIMLLKIQENVSFN